MKKRFSRRLIREEKNKKGTSKTKKKTKKNSRNGDLGLELKKSIRRVREMCE